MKGAKFIIPFSVAISLMIINLVLYLLTSETYSNSFVIIGINVSWLLIGMGLNFYSIDRKEKFKHKFHKFLRHFFIFSLSYFTILAFAEINFDRNKQVVVLSILLILLSSYRWFFFEFRKNYRRGGGNYLNVLVLGKDENLSILEKTFGMPDFGYRYLGYFVSRSGSDNDKEALGSLKSFFQYSLENKVDEVYCAISQFSLEEIQQIVDFTDNNFIRLKLIPDNKGIYSTDMEFELFDRVPVLNIRKCPLDRNYAKYSKRILDIFVSSFVIVFLLSWLMPVLYIINRLESRGPLIFKQLRHGRNMSSFWCYKFRSMTVNQNADTQMCTRNDLRITKVGRFIRKTSIDELPQFFNVLLGEMSIVGPRPHMELHTHQYRSTIDKYLVRHFAKPGITGLAQVNGYRGEIIQVSDIVNRTRMDIFYLENWSILLDIKIILQTLYNCFRGEEKAY